jgi:hypothetical protein
MRKKTDLVIFKAGKKFRSKIRSADISTITIENTPGGTPWGQIVL